MITLDQPGAFPAPERFDLLLELGVFFPVELGPGEVLGCLAAGNLIKLLARAGGADRTGSVSDEGEIVFHFILKNCQSQSTFRLLLFPPQSVLFPRYHTSNAT